MNPTFWALRCENGILCNNSGTSPNLDCINIMLFHSWEEAWNTWQAIIDTSEGAEDHKESFGVSNCNPEEWKDSWIIGINLAATIMYKARNN